MVAGDVEFVFDSRNERFKQTEIKTRNDYEYQNAWYLSILLVETAKHSLKRKTNSSKNPRITKVSLNNGLFLLKRNI